jgi:MFS family permease
VVSGAVFLASSTWFSGTAAARSLAGLWVLDPSASAWLTNATQYGFIAGTFLYALTNLADRFNARRVFFVSALLGALFNLGFAWIAVDFWSALPLRFLTGVTLAGVYPVGMKVIASWFRTGLGWRLGVMVGFLTLGTALPYGIAAVGAAFDWRVLVSAASVLAVTGGVAMLVAIGDGPHLRARARVDLRMVFRVFRHPPFRNTALGYFGHMWELYALWSLSAFFVGASLGDDAGWEARVPWIAFVTVAVGAVGCIGGGLVSRRVPERTVAFVSLVVSGSMCLLSGFAFDLPPALLLVFLVVWGVFVVSDSAQFSALAARHAPPEYTGTALTIQNGLGFLVTTLSIQLVPVLAEHVTWRWAFVVLTIGPVVGAWFTRRIPR